MLPADYGEPRHIHLVKDGERDLNQRVTSSELRRIQRRLHDVLWKGSTPDNKIYDQVIKLILAKSHDEKTTKSGAQYRFQIQYPSNTKENPKSTFQNINSLYIEAYRKYLNITKDDSVEGLDAHDFSFEQTAFVVELLQEVSLVQAANNSDVLGSFFEGITREGFKQTKGLFFTHSNVVNFALQVLDIEGLAEARIRSNSLASDKLPYIIDPSCGSGTFLLAAMKQITNHVTANRAKLAVDEDTKSFIRQQFVDGQENAWAGTFLYGIDASLTLSISTKVNMLLRQDGQAHIYNDDGLAPLNYKEPKLRGRAHEDKSVYSKKVAGTFDLVVSNPPFSITLDPHTINRLSDSFELAGDVNSENLFLERWYQLLKPRGRLGAVLPESFFSTKENLNARLFLFAHFNVKAIVSLPKEAFEPWTPTRTSLLFAEKKTVAEEKAWKDVAVRYESRGHRVRSKAVQEITSARRATARLFSHAELEKLAELWSIADDNGATLPTPRAFTSIEDLQICMVEWRDLLDNSPLPSAVRKVKQYAQKMLRDADGIIKAWGTANRSLKFFDLDEVL